jgi:hypothetical protein
MAIIRRIVQNIKELLFLQRINCVSTIMCKLQAAIAVVFFVLNILLKYYFKICNVKMVVEIIKIT